MTNIKNTKYRNVNCNITIVHLKMVKKKKLLHFSFFIRNIKKESQIKLKNTKIAFENCILLLEKKNIWNASNQ